MRISYHEEIMSFLLFVLLAPPAGNAEPVLQFSLQAFSWFVKSQSGHYDLQLGSNRNQNSSLCWGYRPDGWPECALSPCLVGAGPDEDAEAESGPNLEKS